MSEQANQALGCFCRGSHSRHIMVQTFSFCSFSRQIHSVKIYGCNFWAPRVTGTGLQLPLGVVPSSTQSERVLRCLRATLLATLWSQGIKHQQSSHRKIIHIALTALPCNGDAVYLHCLTLSPPRPFPLPKMITVLWGLSCAGFGCNQNCRLTILDAVSHRSCVATWSWLVL